MKIGDCVHIKDGDHAGELGIIVESSKNYNKILTLEGDYHYYNDDGYEVNKAVTI